MGDAFDWYEKQRQDLGEEFLSAVNHVLERITEQPLLYRVLLRDTRQALVRRFPYRILYRVLADEVVVVA